MRIYITGVAGFLGSHLADAFLADGHTVIGCDNLIGGEVANIPLGVKMHFQDCRNLYAMNSTMRQIDVLYHCAATPHEGLSVFSPSLIADNIFGASASVFSAAVSTGVRRVVLCSSMARYGNQPPPFKEERHITAPVDPYGIAKVAAESLLTSLALLHGFEHVIAVPHNIIGPRQRYIDPMRNVAAIMINLMIQGRPPIIYGDGSQKRCFSYVSDAVYCLKEMATRPVDGEVINIGPDEEFITINELAATIADLLGVELYPVHVSGRPGEVAHATCSADKARRLLGYRTKTSLRQGLSEMIEYIRERGPKPFDYHLPIEIVNERTPRTWTERLF